MWALESQCRGICSGNPVPSTIFTGFITRDFGPSLSVAARHVCLETPAPITTSLGFSAAADRSTNWYVEQVSISTRRAVRSLHRRLTTKANKQILETLPFRASTTGWRVILRCPVRRLRSVTVGRSVHQMRSFAATASSGPSNSSGSFAAPRTAGPRAGRASLVKAAAEFQHVA